MVYKNLHYAFLFELLAGLIALLSIITLGGKGIAALAFIGLRPLVLARAQNPPDERVWRLYYNTFKFSLVLTSVTIVATYILFDSLLDEFQYQPLALLTVVPWFVFIHGLVGVILAWPNNSKIW